MASRFVKTAVETYEPDDQPQTEGQRPDEYERWHHNRR
jgi:hypothetical protein